MNVLDLQARLDRGGEVAMPAGAFRPEYPLFVPSDTTVRGADRASVVDASDAGTAFVVGWRRGLLSAGHHAAGGFRTKGDSSIFARGTDWDLGPPNGGWPAVRRLTVSYAATLHTSPSGSWDGCGLCGMLADPKVVDFDDGPSDGSYWGPRPAPVALAIYGGCLVVWVGTTDPAAPYREWRFPMDVTNPVLNVRVTIDPVSGNVDVYRAPGVDTFDNAAPVVSSYASHLNQPFTFAPNHLWPFQIGRLDPYTSSVGNWGGDWYDSTIRLCYLSCDRGPAAGWVVGAKGGGTNYPDYLPLVACVAGRVRYLLTPVRGQEIPDTAGRVWFDTLAVRGAAGSPAIQLGAALGAEFDRVHVFGGTRAVQSGLLAVNYPMTFDRCKFEGQSDRNLFLFKSTRLDIRRTLFEQGLRASATFIQCGGIVADCSVYPAPAAQDVVFDQIGGGMTYERIPADYEAEFRPRAFVEVKPTSIEQGFDATTVRVTDCTVGGLPGAADQAPLVVVKPAAGWYNRPRADGAPPPPITVIVSQVDTRECRVVSEEPRVTVVE